MSYSPKPNPWKGIPLVGDLIDAIQDFLENLVTTIGIRNNTADVGARGHIDFHAGTGISLTIADDPANDEVDVTITNSAPDTHVNVRKETVDIAAQPNLDFHAGTGIALTIANDSPNSEVDITVGLNTPLPVSDLDASSQSDGKAIIASGGTAVWGDAVPKVYSVGSLPLTIGGAANTLNTLLSQSIPGGTIKYGQKRIRVRLGGAAKADATAYQIRVLITFGSVTLVDATTSMSNGFVAASQTNTWNWEFDVHAHGDNSHVNLNGRPFNLSGAGTQIATGLGSSPNIDRSSFSWSGPLGRAALDLTTAQTLVVQVSMSQASSAGAREMYLYEGYIEVVG